MAIITRPLFNNGEFSAECTFDNVSLVVQTVHAVNTIASSITVQMVRSVDDVVLGAHTFPGNSDQVFNVAPLNFHVVLDGQGRITNVYFRTA